MLQFESSSEVTTTPNKFNSSISGTRSIRPSKSSSDDFFLKFQSRSREEAEEAQLQQFEEQQEAKIVSGEVLEGTPTTGPTTVGSEKSTKFDSSRSWVSLFRQASPIEGLFGIRTLGLGEEDSVPPMMHPFLQRVLFGPAQGPEGEFSVSPRRRQRSANRDADVAFLRQVQDIWDAVRDKV